MKRRVLFLTGLTVVLSLMLSPAFADTDYQCLKMCVASGKAGAVCMPMCDAGGNKSGSHFAPSNPALGSNRVFSTFRQLDEKKLEPEKKSVPSVRTVTDYSCINQCLQAKLGYEMCHKSCTVHATANGNKLHSQDKQFLTPDTFKARETFKQ